MIIEKTYRISIQCMLIALLITQCADIHSTQTSRISRLKSDVQSLKKGMLRFCHGKQGAPAAEAQKTPPIGKSAQLNMSQASARQPSFLNQSTQQVSQSSWAQQAKEYAKKQPFNKVALGLAGGAIGAAVWAEAETIKDFAHKTFNMAMFDEDLISSEYSDAIVRIRSEEETVVSMGTAFIIHSQKDKNLYFVLTAAHCVHSLSEIEFKDHPGLFLRVFPLLIRKDSDIAVLFISPESIERFKRMTGKELPAIPATHLSDINPHKNEAVILQGYPAFMNGNPTHYKKRLACEGPPSCFSSLNMMPELQGASGSPIIAIRNKQPKIIGVFVGVKPDNEKIDPAFLNNPFITGMSQLPVSQEKDKKFCKRVVAVDAKLLPLSLEIAQEKHNLLEIEKELKRLEYNEVVKQFVSEKTTDQLPHRNITDPLRQQTIPRDITLFGR